MSFLHAFYIWIEVVLQVPSLNKTLGSGTLYMNLKSITPQTKYGLQYLVKEQEDIYSVKEHYDTNKK